jgi:hypothetical protein
VTFLSDILRGEFIFLNPKGRKGLHQELKGMQHYWQGKKEIFFSFVSGSRMITIFLTR